MKSKIILLTFLLLCTDTLVSQTTLDFTNFNSGAANGWISVNGSQPNQWHIGGAESYYDFFSRSGAYLTGDMGTTYGYMNNMPSVVHLYKDIPIISVNTDMLLTFKLKCFGEENNDYLSIHAISSNITPVAGIELTDGQIGKSEYSGDDYWKGYSIKIDRANFTENYFRLVFTWKNDGNGIGSNPSAIDEVRISELNMNYETWSPKVNLPSARYYGGSITSGYSTYISGGDVTGGGVPTTQTIELDFIGSIGKDLPQLPEAVRLNEMTKIDGKIFSIGGFNTGSTEPTDDVYSLDLSNFQWNLESPFPKKIFYNRLGVYDWKATYSFGGSDETDNLLDKVYYKLSGSVNWLEGTSMPGDGRADGGLAILDRIDKIFYVGGFTNSFDFRVQVDSVLIGTIDTTNPGNITWTTGPSFPGGPRARLRAFEWGRNKVVVVGGVDGDNFGTSTIFNDVWVYDLETNAWSTLPNMPIALCAYMGGSQRIASGLRALFIAGGIKTGPALSNTTYVYYDTTQVATSVDEQDEILNKSFHLSQNYPNPFNPTTKIKFNIPQSTSPLPRGEVGGLVTLKIYDILGNEIATLVNEIKTVGSHEVEFTAEGLSSGVYFYQIISDKFIETKKMVLLR